jgi:hypothetical protein
VTAEYAVNDWRTRAECAKPGYDPEDWVGIQAEARAQAARVCKRRCPVDVAEACVRWAAENGIDWGVWGGVDMATDLGKKLRKRARTEAAQAPVVPRGGRPPLRQQALYTDAMELLDQGCDRATTAGRLGITTKYLENVLRRGAREVVR